MYTPQIFCITFFILFVIQDVVAPSTSIGKRRRVNSKSSTRLAHEKPVDAVELDSSITSKSKGVLQDGENSVATAISDSSSTSSAHSLSSTAIESKAGTSQIKTMEREPLVEEHKRVSFLSSSINLDSALESTYGEELNPARDSLYARVQRLILVHGSVAVAGAAIGYGVHEYQNNGNGTTTTTTESSTSTTADIESLEFGK